MDREEIIRVLDKHLARVMDDDSLHIEDEKQLRDYGVTSLDIVEIVSASMRELKIKIPRPELGEIENIGQLVDKFLEYADKSESP